MAVEITETELPAWLSDPRLVVFVGDGGVGKTTCAAAAAVAAARAGKRVCALTIDPTARLAQALGLTELTDTPSRIDPAALGLQTGSEPQTLGSLDALRLDTEATFDRLVRDLAPNAERAETVLANPIYRVCAGGLGGSDAYMAFQRVYELDATGNYDLLIVDTPPAAHAEELLSAPARLASVIETGASRILADPAIAALRAGTKLGAIAVRAFIAAVSRIAGVELTARISQFADAFEDVLIGLSERADRTGEMLRSDGCRFVHVTTAERTRVGEARDVEQSLRTHGIDVAARIVNRVLPPADPRAAVAHDAPKGSADALAGIHQRLEQLRRRQNAAIGQLRTAAVPLIVLREDSALHLPINGATDIPTGPHALIDLAEALRTAS